ncbi:hypothetical protein C0995_001223, partial [Termitomyces sp. Mi166
MALDKYLMAFAKYALPCKWQNRVQNTILSLREESKAFVDWKIKLENLNALLTNTKSTCALLNVALQAHLEVNMNIDLHAKLDNSNIIATMFPNWVCELTEHDKDLCKENTRTQRLIDANNTTCAAKCQKCKPLADRLSDPPARTQSTSLVNSKNNTTLLHLSKLTEEEKKLLKDHEGCTRCQKLYCSHLEDLSKCPLKTNNTWLDFCIYKTLMLKKCLAAKLRTTVAYAYEDEVHDEDTDSYIDKPQK